MSKHTPGLLYSEETVNGKIYVLSDHAKASRYYDGRIAKIPERRGEGRPNARRIVACWNALDGLEPSGIAELLEAAREALDTLTIANNLRGPLYFKTGERIRLALEGVTGAGDGGTIIVPGVDDGRTPSRNG